jgi:hypothetical protein
MKVGKELIRMKKMKEVVSIQMLHFVLHPSSFDFHPSSLNATAPKIK